MMGTIYQSIEILAKEKGIDPQVILDAVKDAMLVAARKHFHTNEDLVADMDEKTGAIQIFGVKRVWPPQTAADKLGEPFEVAPELAEIARRCGDAFGIDLYGVDIVISQGRPYVVDASSFPGFKGVPDAGGRLARYLRTAAERAA